MKHQYALPTYFKFFPILYTQQNTGIVVDRIHQHCHQYHRQHHHHHQTTSHQCHCQQQHQQVHTVALAGEEMGQTPHCIAVEIIYAWQNTLQQVHSWTNSLQTNRRLYLTIHRSDVVLKKWEKICTKSSRGSKLNWNIVPRLLSTHREPEYKATVHLAERSQWGTLTGAYRLVLITSIYTLINIKWSLCGHYVYKHVLKLDLGKIKPTLA